MKEIMLELGILHGIIVKSFEDDTYSDDDVSFGKTLRAVLKGIDKNELLEMTNKELLVHIHKIQLIESDK